MSWEVKPIRFCKRNCVVGALVLLACVLAPSRGITTCINVGTGCVGRGADARKGSTRSHNHDVLGGRHGRPVPTRQPEALQDLDYQVLGALFRDLLRDSDFNECLGDVTMPPEIVLSDTTPALPMSRDLHLEPGFEPERWIPPDVLDDLWIRNGVYVALPCWQSQRQAVVYAWRGYHPISRRILVRNVSWVSADVVVWSDFRKAYPRAKGDVHAWLPGYSKDRRVAAVHFLAGPSLHIDVGTYLLVRQQGRWKVTSRRLTFYP